jgi:hypothetical protein
MDIGGGTADMAIRHENEFLVLDSVRVAGKSFFQFAKQNFENSRLPVASDFKKNMRRVILGSDGELNLDVVQSYLRDDLGAFYAVAVNEISEDTFQEREENVLKQRAGAVSYQRYRSRLFFRHLLTYALLQACATVIDQKIALGNGINLVLGGNGWGLLLFADLRRASLVLLEEAQGILTLLKEKLAAEVTEEESKLLDKIFVDGVELLNEQSLSHAKTSVALGALSDGSKNTTAPDTSPFAGITIRDLEINGMGPNTIRWCERWSYKSFKKRFGGFENITSSKFAQPDELKNPIDNTLGVFTAVGNSANFGRDNSPDGFWMKLNTLIVKSVTNKLQTEGDRLNLVPINHFLSEVLYPPDAVSRMLDKLAEANIGDGKSEN